MVWMIWMTGATPIEEWYPLTIGIPRHYWCHNVGWNGWNPTMVMTDAANGIGYTEILASGKLTSLFYTEHHHFKYG